MLVTVVVLTIGCGGPRYSFNRSVDGVVTLDDRPLAGVLVQFVPEAINNRQPPISSSFTDELGRFQLKHQGTGNNNQPGAVLGKHLVLVTDNLAPATRKKDEQFVDVLVSRVPEIYGRAPGSPLVVEITADKHDYPLALTGP
jgi:hypothetical protein